MRKENVKRLLLTITAVVVVVLGVVLINTYPLFAMSPTETGQISGTNIYAVKNQMGAVYFVKTNNGYIMIDSGSKPGKFQSSLEKAGIDVHEVKWVFLTHSDYDHVAGLTMFPNAEIFMNEDELPLINGSVKRSPSGGNKMPAGFDINKIKLLRDSQEILCSGTSVTCIKAPGHTPGSMAYMVDGHYLFTGDAFLVKKGKIDIHPFTMDKEQAKLTIGQLTGIFPSASIVFTSHYGYFKGQP